MVAKKKTVNSQLGGRKLSRSFRQGRAGTDSVHTHSLEYFGGKKCCSPWALPKGGLKKSPAWKLLLKRSEGKVPDVPHKRLGAPIRGGFPVEQWPANVLVDTERAFWLPDDWGQGIKNTGTGGTYIGWISPTGKFLYHKNLGGRFEQGVEVEVGRLLTAADGFNGILRKVETRVPHGADERFLNSILSASERKHVVKPDAFHFCVISARRATLTAGQNDIMLLEAHFRHVGLRPTWYVDAESVDAYRALGLNAIVGGKLTPARNLALEHARAKKKVCVQVSDDISLWEYFDIPQLHGVQGDFKKMNGVVAKAEKTKKVFPVSPLGAAQFLLAKMRSHSAAPQLGGVFPQANMAMGVCMEEFSLQHFILGDFFVAEWLSSCRFDTTMTLKEDYDFTAAHLATHGAVLRCNRLILRVKHATNAGGAVSARDDAGAKERQNIEILQRKWPGVFSLNGRRQNEVVMHWARKQWASDDSLGTQDDARPSPQDEAVAGAMISGVASPSGARIAKHRQCADGCAVEDLQDVRADLASSRLTMASKSPPAKKVGQGGGKAALVKPTISKSRAAW